MCAFSKIGADWARIGRGLSAFANLDMRRARVGCVLGAELENIGTRNARGLGAD